MYHRSVRIGVFVIVTCVMIVGLQSRCCFGEDSSKLMKRYLEAKERQKAINQTRKLNRRKYPKLRYISAASALAAVKKGKMILIDVNSKGYYRNERHIVGAINIPGHLIPKVNLKLRKDALIGVYCM